MAEVRGRRGGDNFTQRLEIFGDWGNVQVRNKDFMNYQLLGQSGLRVSELCLGTMTFGEE